MDTSSLHDATLLSATFVWGEGVLTLLLRNYSKAAGQIVTKELTAEGVCNLIMPREQGWGPSVSINEVRGPVTRADGKQVLEIEMQTGDIIQLAADRIALPQF
jgi:hypothetical protein